MKTSSILFSFIIFIQLAAANNYDSKLAVPPVKKIVKVGAFSYNPGIFLNENGKMEGFIIEFLDEIASQETWEIEYVNGSWSEGLERIKNGTVDLLTSVAYTTERDEYLDYSKNEILTVWGEVYVRENTTLSSVFELENKKIGVMRADFNGKAFINLVNSFHIDCEIKEYDNFQNIFNAVEEDSIFAGVVNNLYGLSNHDDYNLKSSEIIFNPFDIHFAVAEGKNSDLLSIIDNYLTKWKANHESIYYNAISKWTRQNVNVVNITPEWLSTLLYSLSFIVIVTTLFIILLRKQIKKATKQIKEDEEKFRLLAESVNVISWEFDLIQDKWNYVSPQAESILGFKPEDWKDFNWWAQRIHPDDRVRAVEFCETETKKIRDHAFEYRFITKDGNLKWINDIVNVQRKNDKPVILRGIMIDISDKKNAEKAVLESNRLSAIGEIASSIAHDFNNSLQSIIGNLELALLHREIPDTVTKYLDSIYIAASDSANRIKTLQRFGSKKNKSNTHSSVKIVKIIEEVIQQSRPLWKDNIEKEGKKIIIKTDFSSNSFVMGDAGELRSAFYNIIKNSIEAMPEGGTISISTSEKDNFISLVFSDTGIGMDDETKNRLFQPFFTTKGFEQGRGLGMSSVYSLVRDLGGKTTVLFTAPNQGTTIEILLPIITEVNEMEIVRETLPDEIIPNILWVDDDNMIREVAYNLFESLNYSGDVVGNGEKALELLQQNNYDLVITDIGMAGMSGWQLASAIRERYDSKIKIAFLSGWGEEIDETELKKNKIDYLLSKPFKISDLQELVNKVVNGKNN